MNVYIDGVRYIPQKPKVVKKQDELCNLIFYARQLMGETLDEAAGNMGTTKGHLWSIERGETMPRLPMLQKVLSHFDIDFDQIAPQEEG